jgi:hypothetical protein
MTQYLDCYTRVSTAEQKSGGNSLTVQSDIGQRVAEKHTLKFRHRDEGARSSTIHYRDVLEQLKTDIANGKVKHIWCLDRSRMFRDMTDGLMFRRDYLEKHNVRLYEGEHGSEVKFDNENEMLTYDLLTRLQEYENKTRSERSQRGKVEKLKRANGKSVFMGGTALFGYENRNKQWCKNEDEAEWVTKIFDEYERTLSVRSVKTLLENAGVKSRRGRYGLWNLTTIQNMLQNKTYTGIHEVKIKKIDQSFSFKVDKIISITQFNRVQKVFNRHNLRKKKNQKHESLLGEFLLCECGTKIGSEVKQLTKKDGTKINTKKYFCMNRNYEWRDGIDRGCRNKKSLDMDATDSAVLDRVKQVASNSVLLKDRTKKEVLDRKSQVEEDIIGQRNRLEDKGQRIQREIDNVENQIADLEVEVGLGKRERSVVTKIIKRYEEALELQHQEYQLVEQELERLDDNLVWVDGVERFSEQLNLSTRSFSRKREFMRGLIDKVVIKSEMGEDRIGKAVQVGHSFEICFKLQIVADKLSYFDESSKSKGYEIKNGNKILKTDRIDEVTAKAGRRSVKKKEE